MTSGDKKAWLHHLAVAKAERQKKIQKKNRERYKTFLRNRERKPCRFNYS